MCQSPEQCSMGNFIHEVGEKKWNWNKFTAVFHKIVHGLHQMSCFCLGCAAGLVEHMTCWTEGTLDLQASRTQTRLSFFFFFLSDSVANFEI